MSFTKKRPRPSECPHVERTVSVYNGLERRSCPDCGDVRLNVVTQTQAIPFNELRREAIDASRAS